MGETHSSVAVRLVALVFWSAARPCGYRYKYIQGSRKCLELLWYKTLSPDEIVVSRDIALALMVHELTKPPRQDFGT